MEQRRVLLSLPNLVVLFLLCNVATAANSPMQNLFTLDCTGALHFPLGASAQFVGLPDLFSQFQSAMLAQVKTLCPGLSQVELTNEFAIPQAFIYLANQGSATNSQCPSVFPLTGNFMPANSAVNLNLPSTCSLSTYSTEGCTFSMTFPDGVTVGNTIIKSCPTSGLPFIQVTASGPLADQLLMPCSSNADCTASGLTCQDLTSGLDTSFFSRWISDYYWGSCATFSNLLSQVRNNFWSSFYSSSSSSSSVSTVCAPANLITNSNAILSLLPTCTSTSSYSSASGITTYNVNCPTLENGPSASSLTTDDMNGVGLSRPSYPNCIGGVTADCTGNFAVNLGDNIGVGVNLPFLPNLETTLFNYLQGVVSQCGLSSYSSDSFWDNFAPWALQGYMARGTVNSDTTPLLSNSPIGEIYTLIQQSMTASQATTKMQMPQGCSYSDFVQNSGCNLLFQDFSTLLQTSSADVFAQITSCPNTRRPALDLNIQSPMATLFVTPAACNSSISCPNGLICTDISRIYSSFWKIDMWQIINSNSNSPGSLFNFLINFLEGTQGVSYGSSYCIPKVTAITNGWQQWVNGLVNTPSPSVIEVNGLETFSSFQCPANQVNLLSGDSEMSVPNLMFCTCVALFTAMISFI